MPAILLPSQLNRKGRDDLSPRSPVQWLRICQHTIVVKCQNWVFIQFVHPMFFSGRGMARGGRTERTSTCSQPASVHVDYLPGDESGCGTARNTTGPAISSGVPQRPEGIDSSPSCRISGLRSAYCSIRLQYIRRDGVDQNPLDAHSTASALVNCPRRPWRRYRAKYPAWPRRS